MPLTRRSLLAAIGAVVLTAPAGCTPFNDQPAPRARPSPPPPDPLLPLLDTERALLAQYDTVLARYPQLAPRIGPLRTDHAAHLAAVRAIVGVSAASPPATAAPSPSQTPAAPATAPAALASLRAAESAGARLFSSACLAAPPARAALLGSIAACESAHLGLLR